MAILIEALKNKLGEIQQRQLQSQEVLRNRQDCYQTIKDYIDGKHVNKLVVDDYRNPTLFTTVVSPRIDLGDDLNIFSDKIQAGIKNTTNPLISLVLFSSSDKLCPDAIRVLFFENTRAHSQLPYQDEDSQFALLPSGHVLSKKIRRGKEEYTKENPPDTGVFGVVAIAIKEDRLYPDMYS